MASKEEDLVVCGLVILVIIVVWICLMLDKGCSRATAKNDSNSSKYVFGIDEKNYPSWFRLDEGNFSKIAFPPVKRDFKLILICAFSNVCIPS